MHQSIYPFFSFLAPAICCATYSQPTYTRHYCRAFWRCCRSNSTKHWWRKVPAWKPQWNAHKGSFVIVVVSCCSGSMFGHVVVFSTCGLQTAHLATCDVCCGCHHPVVNWYCVLLRRIYGWAVAILVRLGCWVWELACDSERFDCCGKSHINIFRNLTSLPVYE